MHSIFKQIYVNWKMKIHVGLTRCTVRCKRFLDRVINWKAKTSSSELFAAVSRWFLWILKKFLNLLIFGLIWCHKNEFIFMCEKFIFYLFLGQFSSFLIFISRWMTQKLLIIIDFFNHLYINAKANFDHDFSKKYVML